MTIGRRILALTGALLLINLAAGLISLRMLSRLAAGTGLLAEKVGPSIYLAGRINTGSKAILLRIYRHVSSDSTEQMAKCEAYAVDREKSLREELRTYSPLAQSAEERHLLSRIGVDLDRMMAAWKQARPLSQSGQKREAIALFDRDGTASADDMDNAVKDLVAINNKMSEQLQQAAAETAGSTLVWAAVVAIPMLLFTGVMASLVVRGINGALRRTVREVSDEARVLLGATGRISTASESVARDAAEHAASLDAVAASSAQIDQAAQRNAADSQAAVELVEQSQRDLVKTREALAGMVQAMTDIATSSGKVSQIIRIIDEIAFQTNILALNAAVEAARAGEAGLGFAVVADEVRNLAGRSAQAARDTAALLSESQSLLDGGRHQVDVVARSIQGVAVDSGKVRDLVKRIGAGTAEQAQSVAESTHSVAKMEQLTHATSSSAQESAGAAAAVHEQTEALFVSVERLAGLVDGGNSHRRL